MERHEPHRRTPLRDRKPGTAAAEELFERISKHDSSAVSELYDLCAPRLLGIARGILAERTAAEEVVLDVLRQLWKQAPRVQEAPPSLAAWLVLTARAAAVDRLRSQRGQRRLAGARWLSLDQSSSWLPQPAQIALLDGRRELLRKIFDQLPASQRGLLELAVFGGYTESEIAEKVGEPLARVKSGLRASMRFLRHRLEAVLGTWAANI